LIFKRNLWLNQKTMMIFTANSQFTIAPATAAIACARAAAAAAAAAV
jgi:hypothetical protein